MEEIKVNVTTQKLIGLILFAFLSTFVIARLFAYFVLGKWDKDFFLMIRNVHVHHFTYGVFLLALIGMYFILRRPKAESKEFKISTLIYGVGLGLTFDEFGMWLRLEDIYWARLSYDAVLIVTLLLLNIAYHKQIGRGIKEIFRFTLKKPAVYIKNKIKRKHS